MFFVTDLPILFNVETGAVTKIEPIQVTDDNGRKVAPTDSNGRAVYQVTVNGQKVYIGDITECKDFIFSLAGWVGAVNPVTNPVHDRVGWGDEQQD